MTRTETVLPVRLAVDAPKVFVGDGTAGFCFLFVIYDQNPMTSPKYIITAPDGQVHHVPDRNQLIAKLRTCSRRTTRL
jgi:hypothetical protein